MSKHPLDHDRGASTSRLERFAAAARADLPSRASRDLQQRERTKGEGKVKAFTKIEKVGSAG